MTKGILHEKHPFHVVPSDGHNYFSLFSTLLVNFEISRPEKAHVGIFIEELYLLFQPFSMGYVIGIHPGNILCFRNLEPFVQRFRQADIFIIFNYSQPCIGIPFQDFPRPVGRSIIDDQKHKVPECLMQNTIHSTF